MLEHKKEARRPPLLLNGYNIIFKVNSDDNNYNIIDNIIATSDIVILIYGNT